METITNVIEKNILLIKIFSITDIRYHPPYKQQNIKCDKMCMSFI